MKKIVVTAALALSIIPSLAFPMAQWDRANRPELMENNYERNFSKLPKSAKLKTLPWSDDYWPTYKGGITYRWNQLLRRNVDESIRWSYGLIEDTNNLPVSIDELSPAEKYDLYLGRTDFPLTKYERERTKIMKTIPGDPSYDKDFKIPEWEGICHAWAPATLQYKNSEPITVVGKNGQKISFGSSDMHALLSYHLHLNKTSKTGFLGSRCNLDFKELQKKFEKKEITKKELEEKMNSAECSDTNAGAFHVALTNQIGLMNEGFVADVTRDSEVWNQPIYSYEVKVLGESNRASPGAAPGTVKEITVFTKMGYVGEIEQTWEVISKPFYIKYEEYEYRVELNASGEIIGGEWLSEDRPDFIWKSAPVPFKGYFKDLEKLYKKSVQYLSPSKFTFELKDKIQRTGRVSLIEREFIKDARIAALRTKLRNGTIDQMVKHIAAEGFKEAGAKEKAERIASNMAILKHEARTNILAAKFVEGAKEEVRNAHIKAALVSVDKKLNKNYLTGKFIKEVKAEVRDSHINAALISVDKKLNKKYLTGKFIKEVKAEVRDSHIEAAVTDAKEKLHTRYLVKTFADTLSKDAKETRRIKEEHKKAALKEIRIQAAGKFIANKFVTEVSKDAKAARTLKEAHKAEAKAELKKFAVRNFYGKKVIKDLEEMVANNVDVQARRKLEAQKKLDQSLVETVISGNMTKFEELIKKGANPAFSNEAGLTVLMVAVQNEQRAMVTALLKVLDQKAINAVDKEGKNALIWAITAPNQRPDRDTRALVRELLEKNIEVNQKDSSGKSALAYVTSGTYKSKLIAWALKDKGAKL